MNRCVALAIVAWLFVMSPALRAEDWTTRDGQVYHDVKVLDVKPDYVTILHHDGGGRVALADLPADLQKRFNYDPAKAKAAAAQTAMADAANERSLHSERTVAETALDLSSPPASTTVNVSQSSPSAVYSDELFVDDRTAGPAPINPTHFTTSDAANAGQQMRRSLSDPTYSTMSHLVYMVNQQGLGPDKNDPNHHTIDDIAGH
jgi:hypothetical protein